MRRFLIITVAVILLVVGGSYLYANSRGAAVISTSAPIVVENDVRPEGEKPIISSFSVEIENKEGLFDMSLMGDVYFILGKFEGEHSHTYQLVKLPGLCVIGKVDCPAPIVINTPFDPQNTTGLDWSPDGGKGLALEIFNAEMDWGMRQVPPSRMYVFDPVENEWTTIFETTDFIIGRGMNSLWSPDGNWIAFTLRTVDGTGKSENEKLFVIHPDGSGMKMVFSPATPRFSWAGNRLLLQTYEDLDDVDSDVVIYAINPESNQAELIFKPDRFASLHPAHDGKTLAYADQQNQKNPTPIKEIRLLDLSGNVLQVMGSYSNMYTGIFPVVWSADDSHIAFGNFGRMYIGGLNGDPVEIFKADDSHVQPGIWNAAFSPDGNYVLLEVYDGMPKLVAVSVDGKFQHTVIWEGQGDLDQPISASWQMLPSD